MNSNLTFKRPVAYLIAVYLLAYFVLLCVIASDSLGQSFKIVPDCCEQTRQLQIRYDKLQAGYVKSQAKYDSVLSRLTDCRAVLKQTRQNQETLDVETKKRFAEQQRRAENTEEIYAGNLAEQKALYADLSKKYSDYESVKAERDKLKGRTWAGRKLRQLRNGLAVVGGVAIVSTVLLLR